MPGSASPAPPSPAASISPSASPSAPSKAAQPKVSRAQFIGDAILDQVKFTDPTGLVDQLVTIAMSPLTREVAAQNGLKTTMEEKGKGLVLVIVGKDGTCRVTVSDEPTKARGISCD